MEDRVSFSLDGLIGLLRTLVEFAMSLFRPVAEFMRQVAGESWLGFALVFALGFTLLLIRWGAKSSSGIAVYGGSLEYVGKRGLLACACALALLCLEYALMPPITIIVTALENSVTGGEPGLAQLLGFLFSPSPARAAFLGDVATFYSEEHTAFPLGVRAVALLGVAFGSMLTVGKAAGAVVGRPPPA